jgi:hypothetical protein
VAETQQGRPDPRFFIAQETSDGLFDCDSQTDVGTNRTRIIIDFHDAGLAARHFSSAAFWRIRERTDQWAAAPWGVDSAESACHQLNGLCSIEYTLSYTGA